MAVSTFWDFTEVHNNLNLIQHRCNRPTRRNPKPQPHRARDHISVPQPHIIITWVEIPTQVIRNIVVNDVWVVSIDIEQTRATSKIGMRGACTSEVTDYLRVGLRRGERGGSDCHVHVHEALVDWGSEADCEVVDSSRAANVGHLRGDWDCRTETEVWGVGVGVDSQSSWYWEGFSCYKLSLS